MTLIEKHQIQAQIKGYDLVESSGSVTIVTKKTRKEVESFSGNSEAMALLRAVRALESMPILSMDAQ